ncbi:MAG: 23S rRNA pseudouridine1911/1915/1917 synthase [Rickettsiales bacterium]|jgi:23S rRNA pseudouridine1911/1915/1917 synthase
MTEIIFEASSEDLKQRLDKFLVGKLVESNPEFSRSRIQLLIASGNVFSGDNPITNSDYKIKGSEKFIIQIPEAKESKVLAKEIPFEIVFEDENMLVVNKPAGLTTHPGAGNQDYTLVNALLFYCGETLSGINGVMRPGIVHRLDKDTSGLMVVAKNDLAHQNLSKQIEQRTLKRNYLAICYGTPKPLKGVINKNLGRSKANRLKMAIMRDGGRVAITNYEVKKMYFNSTISLIDCKLDTGRTHQIRVHMASIGHCIIGDQTYGSRKLSLGSAPEEIKDAVHQFPRQALHSYKISFFHPVSNEEMEFEIDFPADMKNLSNKISNE